MRSIARENWRSTGDMPWANAKLFKLTSQGFGPPLVMATSEWAARCVVGSVKEANSGVRLANSELRFTRSGLLRHSTFGLRKSSFRRLGRSGLADPAGVYDKVFHLDVPDVLPKNASNIHSAVFEHAATLKILRLLLRGRERLALSASHGERVSAGPVRCFHFACRMNPSTFNFQPSISRLVPCRVGGSLNEFF